MKFNKKLTCKLSRPVAMLALAGASLFPSCNKDDDHVDIKQVVYTFSLVNMDIFENLDSIRAAADTVDQIVFQNDEKEPFSGVNMQVFYERGITWAFDAAQGKGKGKGTFRGVDDIEDNRNIEAAYKKLGFKGFKYSKENQR